MSEEKAKVSNLVTLANGEVLDFGANGKCFSSFDVETGDITFKMVTGEVITFNKADVPAEVQELALLSGLLKKVTITLPTVDADKAADKVALEIQKLKDGKFTTRGSGAGAAELDDFLVAFALVNATGVVNTGNGNFAVPNAFISVDGLRPEWVDVNSPKVIQEVLEHWESLSAKEKTSQRRQNTYVNMQKQFIETGVVEV